MQFLCKLTVARTTIVLIQQDNIDDWLDQIGLQMYKLQFKNSNIVTRQNLEGLKDMSADQITQELNMHKKGTYIAMICQKSHLQCKTH